MGCALSALIRGQKWAEDAAVEGEIETLARPRLLSSNRQIRRDAIALLAEYLALQRQTVEDSENRIRKGKLRAKSDHVHSGLFLPRGKDSRPPIEELADEPHTYKEVMAAIGSANCRSHYDKKVMDKEHFDAKSPTSARRIQQEHKKMKKLGLSKRRKYGRVVNRVKPLDKDNSATVYADVANHPGKLPDEPNLDQPKNARTRQVVPTDPDHPRVSPYERETAEAQTAAIVQRMFNRVCEQVEIPGTRKMQPRGTDFQCRVMSLFLSWRGRWDNPNLSPLENQFRFIARQLYHPFTDKAVAQIKKCLSGILRDVTGREDISITDLETLNSDAFGPRVSQPAEPGAAA